MCGIKIGVSRKVETLPKILGYHIKLSHLKLKITLLSGLIPFYYD